MAWLVTTKNGTDARKYCLASPVVGYIFKRHIFVALFGSNFCILYLIQTKFVPLEILFYCELVCAVFKLFRLNFKGQVKCVIQTTGLRVYEYIGWLEETGLHKGEAVE